MSTGKEYRTKDVDEAAFLWTHPFVEYKREERQGRTVFFIYASEKDMEAMLQDFHAKRATVEPKAYSQRQQDVRDILHRIRRTME